MIFCKAHIQSRYLLVALLLTAFVISIRAAGPSVPLGGIKNNYHSANDPFQGDWEGHWGNGKKVVLYAHSGGTIVSYAFLMSQSEEWRKANILAYLPVVPVTYIVTSTLYDMPLLGTRSDGGRCTTRRIGCM